MRTPTNAAIIIAIMLFLDVYVYQSIKALTYTSSVKTKAIVHFVYWAISIIAIIGFLLFIFTRHEFLGRNVRSYLFAIVIGFFMAKLVAVLFFIIDDLRRGIQWVAGKLFFNNTESAAISGDGISRCAFLSWLGIAAGGTLFGSLIYGFGNKYNYKVKPIQLTFENLPQAFKGIKIVHISDIHTGSFTDKKSVLKGVQKIMDQKADIILFTGDLVNDMAIEMNDYMDVFSQLKAPMGVYSCLGNHDYGDYVVWPVNGVSQQQNLEDIKKVHADLGWRLLVNEHIVLEKEGQQIALLGVENWSAKRSFSRHGRMDLAHAGTEKYPFKILLSHDPSHWDAEIKPGYPDVDLMLSGHTHGMQFGVELPGFKWSPVQYMYKQWGGLYEDANQKLYVNTGFGFIGYPGRVGVLPEITLIELS
ncbi:MAG: metallophosphoesterase [Chitinophagaceae bacterium]|nr:metallophosphoesterase [Chitinophagaceae bacterium]